MKIAAQPAFVGIRGNDTHQFAGVKEDGKLEVASLDDGLITEVSRDDLGLSLAGFDSEMLVKMGVRILKKDGKWEMARLRP